MTTLVVDASVAAKWFFEEDHSDAAIRLISPRRRLLAPDLIWAEVGNVIWKRARRNEITEDDARGIIADLLRMPLEITSTATHLPLAIELAMSTGRTVYDSLYLALAIERRCRLITADDRLLKSLAATPLARHIRSLGRR